VSGMRTLAAIATACPMILAASTASAQVENRDPCVDRCDQIKEKCIEACDVHDDPVECDERCNDSSEDCLRQCR